MTKENLSKYLAAAGAIAGVAGANAQIVYTDVDPDVTLNTLPDSTQFYLIDMDNNLSPDFATMAVRNSSSSTGYAYLVEGVGLAGIYSNQWAATSSNIGTYSVEVLQLLNSGVNVGAGLQWATSSSYGWAAVSAQQTSGTVTYSLAAGKWFGEADGYAGVRFAIGGNVHYGWIRLGVSADGNSITVKDYAYNAQPDSSILTGQTTSVSEIGLSNVQIYSNLDRVYVQMDELNGAAKLELLDLSGKLIETRTITSAKSVIRPEVNTGIYLAKFTVGDSVITRKLYLTK